MRGRGVAHHVGQRLLDDPEAGLPDRDRNCVAVQLDVGVGVEAGCFSVLEKPRHRCEVEAGRRRCGFVSVAQKAERRAQVVECGCRYVHDVSQRAIVVARAQVGGNTGADVDRYECMRDGVVEVAGDSEPLVGDAAAAFLLALLGDPEVALAPGLAELTPRSHSVADDDGAEHNAEPDPRVGRDAAGGDDHDHRQDEDRGGNADDK